MTSPVTYRTGTFVVDVRENRLVQVIGTTEDDDRVQVRRPGGGLEWEVPPTALRLATREERNTAGLRPYQTGCTRCAELEAARQAAATGDDSYASRRATADALTHWVMEHCLREGRP
ncbi:hypothetical protein I5Q34_17430 [Streptomyces sp. AV19]|uniref:hypothetical protein n=1 Tax=Streptomyces sp. AV19 TaxID=2793068 RepID=UPI0018FE2EDF|nr:hypothetical protein [Streptomyces sp. AV19]MBH1936029.1 hypothetical protein [Streptomyces sp. AV19]MDG4534179.1 hypothetical protein [Streptomyces sp. AV19]